MRKRLPDDCVAGLARRAANGDQGAWNALVDEFGGLVWAVTRAHRLSGADAADVVQTTWMRLVENLDRIRDPSRLGTWLTTTARRESLRALRRSARLIPRGDELSDLPADERDPGERLLTEQRAVAVHTALDRLRPRDRAMLRMLAAEPSPSYEEIGAALGMPIGSIGPTRARVLARLRREVAGAGVTA